MKSQITFALLLAVSLVFGQRNIDQFSIEGGAGLSIVTNPSLVNFSNFNFGARYMFNEDLGLKLDYGYAQLRTDSDPKTGTNYNRISVQGVYNLGKVLDIPGNTNHNFNILVHGGFGYSSLTSTERGGTDRIGNVILGITPQLRISDEFAFMTDFSGILNFKQHYKFDGFHPPKKQGKMDDFVGKMFTASIGIIYYIGGNKSEVDFR